MGVRRESVELTLDDRFTKQMGAVIAVTALAERELNKLDGAGRRGASGVNEAEKSVVAFERTTRTATPTIDKLSGRLELLAHTAMALGPALVPIGAVAIPAVTALASGFGFAAIGATTMELAFHNLAPALTAFNKASLEPTAANIAAAKLAMDKLSPSAQRFVLTLHAMEPEFVKLQQAAASGLFPGLTSGMDALMKDGPLARTVLHGIGQELGTLADEAGHALSSDEWRPFLKFVGTEGPRELDVFAHATGDVLHGLAQLWMALTPLNGQVDSGILAVAQDFDRWATSLDKTQGFQDFMEYVRTNGPRVEALLGDTAQLFTDIVQAAAPLGGPTLQALDLIVKALDLLASSPLATPILALLQINSVLKLTSAGMRGLGIDASIGLGGITKSATASKGALSGVLTEAKAAGLALRTMGGNIGKNSANGTPLLAGVNKEGLANLAKGVGLVAGVGILSSGVADKIGATNTATMGLVGSMAGPLGTAVGATVGAFEDWRSAVSTTDASIKALQATSSSFDLSSQRDQIALTVKAYNDSQASFGNFIDFSSHLITGGPTALDRQRAAIGDAQAAQQTNTDVLSQLFTGLNGGPTRAAKVATSSGLTFAQQMAQTASRAQPAMAALGISVKQLDDAAAAGDLGQLVHQIVDWTNKADSAQGRTDAVAAAFAKMGDQSLTASDRVQALSDALDALLGPGLNESQASDAFQKSLNDLTAGLAKHSRALQGNSDAAIQNRTAIRGLVTSSVDLIKAQAQAGASPKVLTRNLQQQRAAIIAAGTAAGLSKSDMEGYLHQLGLTPKLIKTTIAAVGIAQVESQLKNLTRDRVIHITVQADHLGAIDTTGTGGHVLTGRASGGTIPGQRHPYGDKILIMAAPGEEVISNRHGQADQFRLDRALGRIPHYGFGGTIGTTYTPNPSSSTSSSSSSSSAAATDAATKATTKMTPAMKALHHEIDASGKAISKERAARDALVQKEQSLIQAVEGAFRSDIFASATGVWGANGGFNPIGALQGDISGARQFDRLLHQLDRRGVGGGALAAIAQTGSVQDAQMLAAESNRQLREYGRLFRQRQRLSHDVGQYAGDSVYGARIAQMDRELQADKAHRKVVETRLHEIEKATKANAAKTASALNQTAATAARRVKR